MSCVFQKGNGKPKKANVFDEPKIPLKKTESTISPKPGETDTEYVQRKIKFLADKKVQSSNSESAHLSSI